MRRHPRKVTERVRDGSVSEEAEGGEETVNWAKAFVSVCAVALLIAVSGCGSNTGVFPTKVTKDFVTLPGSSILYLRADTLACCNFIDFQAAGQLVGSPAGECAPFGPPDANNMHPCTSPVTLKKNTDYSIVYLDRVRGPNVDFHD